MLFVDRLLNLCNLFTVFMAKALHVVICGIMHRVENVRPNTVALFVYGIIFSSVMMGCVVRRDAKKHVFFKPCFLCKKKCFLSKKTVF